MVEYIEREIVLHEISKNEFAPIGNVVSNIYDAVKAIPVADVAPIIHGKWKGDVQCSNCGWYMEDDVTISPMMVFFNYCPDCGTKMDGGT